MTTTIQDLVPFVKCKNAGPFRITIDLIFDDEDRYEIVKKANVITEELIAETYNIPKEDVVGIRDFDPASAIKINIKRPIPSGDPRDPDVMGCQQHVPILYAEVEDPF